MEQRIRHMFLDDHYFHLVNLDSLIWCPAFAQILCSSPCWVRCAALRARSTAESSFPSMDGNLMGSSCSSYAQNLRDTPNFQYKSIPVLDDSWKSRKTRGWHLQEVMPHQQLPQSVTQFCLRRRNGRWNDREMAGHPRIISVWCSPNRGFILTKVQQYNLVDSGVKTKTGWWILMIWAKGIEMPIGLFPCNLDLSSYAPFYPNKHRKADEFWWISSCFPRKNHTNWCRHGWKKKTQIWRARKSHDILGACSSYLVPKYPSKPATSTWKGVKMQRQSQWKSVRVVGWQISQN